MRDAERSQNVEPDDVFGPATIKVDSRARSLIRYVKVLPKSTFLPASLMEDLIHGAEIDIDVMHKLAALIVYQEQRVTRAGKLEQEMNLPLPAVREEIKLLADLYRQMLDTQIALGYEPSQLVRQTTMKATSGRTVGQSQLERMLADHPEHLAKYLPLIEAVRHLPASPRS